MAVTGRNPMPWQRDALDVACEIDPATGTFWYDTVIIVVLRRAGKTTISRAKLTHRALTTQDGRMVYTAQNRLKALKRLRDDFYIPLDRSLLKVTLGKPRWRGGEEALRWKNGSELAIDAVSDNTGHGDANHEGHIDEAYAHRDHTIEGGLQPTLMTVPGSQMWVLSAAGNSESAYLWDKVQVGRALIESGVQSRTCYIEYSAPEHWDPEDPETLLNTHPAVGWTVPAERIMGQRQNSTDLAEWERAWYGWWPKAKAPPRILPALAWESNYIDSDSEDEPAWHGTPFWGVDTSPDRETTSIALAARSTDSTATAYVELFDALVGTAGVVKALVQQRSIFGGNLVALDGNGAAKSLKSDLEKEGFTVVLASGPQRVDACGQFYDEALTGTLRFMNDPLLNTSMGHAVKQYVGGAAWIYNKRGGLGDISGLYAVTFAKWLMKEKLGDDYDIEDSML